MPGKKLLITFVSTCLLFNLCEACYKDLHSSLTSNPPHLPPPIGSGRRLRDGKPLKGGSVLEAAAQLAQRCHEGELSPRGHAEAGLGCGAGDDW